MRNYSYINIQPGGGSTPSKHLQLGVDVSTTIWLTPGAWEGFRQWANLPTKHQRLVTTLLSTKKPFSNEKGFSSI